MPLWKASLYFLCIMVYRMKTDAEIPSIKASRWWYEVVQNPTTKQRHLRRKATNGQILWWTESYVNKQDALLALNYPAFDGQRDLLIG